jgi:hypothetical protein
MRPHGTNGRYPGRRTAAVVGLGTTAALVLGACAQEASTPDTVTGGELGDFAATTDYLSGVARAAEEQSFRMAIDMTMRGSAPGEDEFEASGQMITGEVDGETSSMVLDMGPMMDDLPPGESVDGDLTMTMVTDGEAMYVQAPLFGTLAEMALSEGATRSDLGPLAALAELDEGEWGRVDLEGLTMAEVAQTTGAQGVSADVFLDMAADGEDVEDLGTEDIRGVETRGLGATSTFEDMILAQGVTLDEFRDQFPTGVPGEISEEELDTVIDAMLDLEIPLEVWVDDDDNVRRVTFALDMTELMSGLAELDPSAAGVEMSMDMSMDLFDYGDESIQIEVPTESTDVTDEFLELMEGTGFGGASGGPVLGST